MQLELTASTFSLAIIAQTKDAIYLRLPLELQRDCGGCDCRHCKLNPALAKWDTLVVPVRGPTRPGDAYNDWHTWTVHMPDDSVQAFIDSVKRQEAKK